MTCDPIHIFHVRIHIICDCLYINTQNIHGITAGPRRWNAAIHVAQRPFNPSLSMGSIQGGTNPPYHFAHPMWHPSAAVKASDIAKDKAVELRVCNPACHYSANVPSWDTDTCALMRYRSLTDQARSYELPMTGMTTAVRWPRDQRGG
jgi:hypothetical protein